MRKSIAFAAAAAACLLIAAPAQAGFQYERDYIICWTSYLNGSSDCARLPRRYKLPGVKKPRARAGTTTFTLTWSRIRCLKGYLGRKTISTMRPTHQATIYAPKS